MENLNQTSNIAPSKTPTPLLLDAPHLSDIEKPKSKVLPVLDETEDHKTIEAAPAPGDEFAP